MTIEFDESVRAVYYVSGRECDWMAAINAHGSGGFRLRYRFRYYDPADPHNDPHSGKDQKAWFGGTVHAPLPVVLAKMQQMMDMLLASGFAPKGSIACKLVRGSMTLDQYMREFVKLPFVHARTITPEEFERLRK